MSRVGAELVAAFEEMAAWMRGEVEAVFYEVPAELLTPARIRAIRIREAPSTQAFEEAFHIPADVMEDCEEGLTRPDGAMALLLRVIDKEPQAVRRALAASRRGPTGVVTAPAEENRDLGKGPGPD